MSYDKKELRNCRDFLLRLASNFVSHISSDSYATHSNEQKQVYIDGIDTILEMLRLIKTLEDADYRGKAK